MLVKFLTECAKTEGASADDVNTVRNRQLPTTRGGKCLHACVGETVGLVSSFDSFKQAVAIGNS